MMKRWVAGLVAGAALTFAAAPAFAVTAQVMRDLNVRMGPGTNFRILGTLPAFSTIEVFSCTPAWCTIGGPNPAFVSAAFLSFGGPPPFAPGPVAVPVVPVIPVVPVVPVMTMAPVVPAIVTEPNPAVLVAPPPPVYYGPPNRLYVNPPPPLAPTPGYYGAMGIWTW